MSIVKAPVKIILYCNESRVQEELRGEKMLYQVLDLFQNRFLKGMVPIVEADLSKTIRWFHVVELSESLEELSNEVKSGDLLIVMGGGRKIGRAHV